MINKALRKLQPKFTPVEFEVIERVGNYTIIQSAEGVTYRRCVTDLKKWNPLEEKSREQAGGPTTECQSEAPLQSPFGLRPKRSIIKPSRYRIDQTDSWNAEAAGVDGSDWGKECGNVTIVSGDTI